MNAPLRERYYVSPDADNEPTIWERGTAYAGEDTGWLSEHSLPPALWTALVAAIQPPPSEPELADELELLLDCAKHRNGTVGVPAGWVTRFEIEALLEHGTATCPDCEVRIARCSHCGPGEAHCDCTQPSDCAAEDHRLDAGDQQRAEAKEAGR